MSFLTTLFEKIRSSIWLKSILSFVSSLILFYFVYFLSLANAHNKELETVKHEIVTRIALDLPIIPIEKRWLNEVGDEEQIQAYISLLNKFGETQGWNTKVTSITTTLPSTNYLRPHYSDREKSSAAETAKLEYETLFSVEQNIYVLFDSNKKLPVGWLSVFPLLFSICLFGFILYRDKCKEQLKPMELRRPQTPLLLTIDLRSKLLISDKSGKETPLSNKPLCFYCALVEFCIANPGVNLNLNKDLPEEFLLLSQKYFYRLIELGHTIRKRPNFESNLDKTLSEIRAALEDVFEQDIAAKERLVPPKAIGEGSRSKIHSFSLINVNQEFVNIIGK